MTKKATFPRWLFNLWASQKAIISGSSGGLIIGNSHDNGGIPLVSGSFENDEEFEVTGEMEGFEFVMSAKAFEKYSERIISINTEMPLIMDSGVTVKELWESLGQRQEDIVCNNAILLNAPLGYPYEAKMVLIEGTQFIVNKYSSLVHYEELKAMNFEFR